MSEENPAPDLFDLKFLPAWVKEAPNDNRYADFAGEEIASPGRRDRAERGRRGGDRRDRGPRPGQRKERGRDPRERDRRPASAPPPEARSREKPPAPAPAVEMRFMPDARVMENNHAQIKTGQHANYFF